MPYEDEAEASEQPGKIRVVCHGCGARYHVRDSKVRGRRFRATCKRCGGVIVARAGDASGAQAGEIDGSQPSAQPLPTEDLQQEEEACWYVVIGGKPHGPLTSVQVRKSYAGGRITRRTYLWRAGDPEWRRLIEVEDFNDLFSEGEGQTGFYSSPSPDDESGEIDEEAAYRDAPDTVTSGPRGVRGDLAGVGAEEVLGDGYDRSEGYDAPTGYDEREEPDEATRIHRDRAPGAARGGLAAQPSYPPLPPVPRRRAVLPAPTGVPRRPDLLRAPEPSIPAPTSGAGPFITAPFGSPSPPGIGGPSKPPLAPQSLGSTAPLWGPPPQVAPASPAAAFAPTLPPPGGRPGPGAPAVAAQSTVPMPKLSPPPATPFSDPPPSTASPLAALKAPTAPLPPGPLTSLAPTLEPTSSVPRAAGSETRPAPRGGFWTTGKIAALAAIGGGLVVAGTVVAFVAVMRHKQPPAEPPRIVEEPKEIEIKVRRAEPKPAPKPAPKRVAAAGPAATEPAHAEAPQPKAAARVEKTPTVARVKLKKVAARKQPAKATGKVAAKGGGGELAEADALLAEAATPSKKAARKPERAGSPKVDVDDILAAGSGGASERPTKKAAKKSLPASADDILAAGGGSSTLPERPSRAQIEQAMRAVLPRVQSCYDKFQQAGKVEVVVNLRGDGTHDQQAVGTFAGTPTGACVAQAVARSRFPRFSGSPMSFKWPYVLR